MSRDRDSKERLAKALYELSQRKAQRPLDFFKPLAHQKPLFQSTKRNLGVFGGNQSGKTLNGAAWIIHRALHRKSYIICATWADLSVPNQQAKVYELLPKDSRVREGLEYSEKRGFPNRLIKFHNGSIIKFKTYEQGRETFQGISADYIWLDEECPEDLITEIKARLVAKRGTLMRTMTAVNGITYTYDEFILNKFKSPEVEYWFWSLDDNSYISAESKAEFYNNLSEKEAEVRRTGRFVNIRSGLVYYGFHENNVVEHSPFGQEIIPSIPIDISCDFNVSLMSWSCSQCINGIDYIFDEIVMEKEANTEAMCMEVQKRFQNHPAGFVFYVDAAGNQRRTSASRTDITIIKQMFSAPVHYKSIRNIKDRFEATNARLKNAKGDIRLFIHKRCQRLIRDLQNVVWDHFTGNKTQGLLTHASDGLSYMCYYKYPLDFTPIRATRL